MEAFLLHYHEAQELADLDSAREARMGRRVRHFETTAFG